MLKFRCNGNINSDEIYLDDIQLQLCLDVCQDYITHTDNSFAVDSEEAIKGIETNRIIPTGANLDHHAGEFVLMTPGFEVQAQAIYHAFIEACN